jgi:hypothetical protein
MPRTKEKPRRTPSTVNCAKLAAFNGHDFQAIQHAFEHTKSIPMRQAWRKKEEPGFEPGFVRIGWHNNALLVFAELLDADVLSRATGLNQRLWELGDSFEIFLQPVGQSPYTELQVSPSNCQLQLRYPHPEAVEEARKADNFKPYFIVDKAFYSATWVRPAENKWFVFANIPRNFVCESHEPLDGQKWRFSFSRYDYTTSRRKPVVSSTSPHLKPQFHCLKEWGTMRFQPDEI